MPTAHASIESSAQWHLTSAAISLCVYATFAACDFSINTTFDGRLLILADTQTPWSSRLDAHLTGKDPHHFERFSFYNNWRKEVDGATG